MVARLHDRSLYNSPSVLESLRRMLIFNCSGSIPTKLLSTYENESLIFASGKLSHCHQQYIFEWSKLERNFESDFFSWPFSYVFLLLTWQKHPTAAEEAITRFGSKTDVIWIKLLFRVTILFFTWHLWRAFYCEPEGIIAALIRQLQFEKSTQFGAASQAKQCQQIAKWKSVHRNVNIEVASHVIN